MIQLREEGWIHHLARHSVACFLTRGHLWISWEEGMKVKANYFLLIMYLMLASSIKILAKFDEKRVPFKQEFGQHKNFDLTI